MSIAGNQRLKYGLLIFAMIIAVGILAHGRQTIAPSAPALPVITFYDAADEKVTVADFKGTVTLVHLWATWCPPCIAEMPKLDQLQADLGRGNFRIVAISLDRESIAAPQKFYQKNRITHLQLYWDKGRQVPLKWVYAGLPTSYLLDENGAILRQYNGEMPRLQDIRQVLHAQ
jgi:thiol-disulfide isomerase/thioredoxin